ncbi:cytochrome P450 [Apiospora sp. TS-2023a]
MDLGTGHPLTGCFAFVLLACSLTFVVYRNYLHPLSRYPGPALARFSDAYAGFYTFYGDLHLRTYLDLQRYGPVLRSGPNKLVFKSIEALQGNVMLPIEYIYNNDRITKSHVYGLTVASGKPSLFNVIDKRRHREKRRLIGHAISDKSLRAFEPTLIDQIDIFLQQLLLASRQRKSVEVSERSKHLGMDIVGLLSFGYPLQMLTTSDNHFIMRGLKIGAFQANAFMQWPLLKKLGVQHLMVYLGKKQRVQYLRALQNMISTRLAQGRHAKQDLFSFAADYVGNSPENEIGTSELFGEALFFFPAGKAGDTTSTAIAALFFYLSRNPEVYKKLAQEIRSAFRSGSEIRSGPLLQSCRYLRACIDEALRITPPVAGTLWREPYANEYQGGESFVVDGHVIPPGTQVGVSIYAIHHEEAYFPKPLLFRPERWVESDAETLKRMNLAFCPFSLGSRGCAGKSIVAKTLWYFDFKIAVGEIGRSGEGSVGRTDGRGRVDEFQTWDSFGSTHLGPNLVFEPRGELWREIDTKA